MRESSRGLKVQGIILKRNNYKEADRILTVYTDSLGKITALAKGVRKISSKKRGHIEPLSVATLYLIKTGNWYVITQSETIQSNGNLRSNQDSLSLAVLCIEALDKMTEHDEPNIILLKLVTKTLKFLGKDRKFDICAGYLIKLLKISGFYGRNQFLSFLKSKPEIYSDEMVKYGIFLENSTYERIAENSEKFPDIYAKVILGILPQYYELYADIKLKSLDISIIENST